MGELSGKIGRKKEDIVLLKLDSVDISGADLSDSLLAHYSGDKSWEISITYGIKPTFRDVVLAFNANGSVSAKIFKILTASSISELRDAQAQSSRRGRNSNGPTAVVQSLSDEAVATLAAIKILNESFASKRRLWMLVE